MTDRGRIYAASFLRALADGLAGVILGIYIAKLGHSVVARGLVLSAGLAGATLRNVDLRQRRAGAAAAAALGCRLDACEFC